MTDENPVSPRPPLINAPREVLVLIACMAAVHGALSLGGEEWFGWAYATFAFVPALASAPQGYRFLSHAFLHGGWDHLIFNALWLLAFGAVTARALGPWRFFTLFAVSACGGALATLAVHRGEDIYLIGASGGVSGLLAAAVPVIHGHGRGAALRPRELLSSRPAPGFVAIWAAVTLLSGASGLLVPGQPGNIAWDSHLGGFLAGLAAFYFLVPSRSPGAGGRDRIPDDGNSGDRP
jgi:membrane associated rhomboid family serine protease